MPGTVRRSRPLHVNPRIEPRVDSSSTQNTTSLSAYVDERRRQHMLTDVETTVQIAKGAANHDPDVGLRAVAALRTLKRWRSSRSKRAETGLVLAADRRPARGQQADRASQVRPAHREAVMFERFTGDARTVVIPHKNTPGASATAISAASTCCSRSRLSTHRPAPCSANTGLLRSVSKRTSRVMSGSAPQPPCSPTSTETLGRDRRRPGRRPRQDRGVLRAREPHPSRPSRAMRARPLPPPPRPASPLAPPAPRRRSGPAELPSAETRPAPATGRYHAPGAPPTGHLPFTPGAKRTLEKSLREALTRHDRQIGVEHIALSLITADTGPVPPILTALGTSPPTLQTAILDRYRQAS